MVKTHRLEVLKRLGLKPDDSPSIQELARLTKIPVAALRAVQSRGEGAYSNNLGSVRLKDFSKNPDVGRFPASARLSMAQWAMARVYSFLNKGKTYKTADADIAKKYGI
jgi:hypothetical protein